MLLIYLSLNVMVFVILYFLVKREKNQFFVDIRREVSAISLKKSYFESDFIVTQGAAGHD